MSLPSIKARKLPTTLLLILMVVICLFPLYWSITGSLKDDTEIYEMKPSLLVRRPTLDNYRSAMNSEGGGNFLQFFANSIIIASGAVALQLLVGSMAGYGFARIRFRGRDLIFYTMVMIMFIPRVGGLMATYELMDFLHLRNSLFGLILLFASSVSLSLFILRQSFLTVPRELEEAAIIDGATAWQVFLKIALPMVQGTLVVVGTLSFLAAWGDYLTTYTMLDEQRLFTVSIAVRQIATPQSSLVGTGSKYGVDNAIFILSSIPVILVYVAAQKWFIRGYREGILKL
jgi:multiple sugar transport system permease protein